MSSTSIARPDTDRLIDPPTDEAIEALRRRLEADGISHILAQFVDIHGAAKVKLIPAAHLDDAARVGAGFAGGAVWGMGQGPHSHDMCARIDPATYTPLPYEPGVARFAADLYVDGRPHPFCARVNLRRILDRARRLGFAFNVGLEPEFFLVVRRPDGTVASWDPHAIDDLNKPCYDFKAMSGALGFLRAMQDGLNALGWGAYQADHEDANAQFEVNFEYADALTTADRFTFFRMMAGQVAQRFGAVATFMAKPFGDRTGSGAHMHFHLADLESGANAFEADPGADPRKLGLTPTAYHFLGGILAHARALAAVSSPTVNCYKRLQVGGALTGSRSGFTWVPAFLTYGDNNRTQMIRVCGPGHVEDRSFSSACNPYLAAAAYLAAGLDGIERRLDPGEPNLGSNMYNDHPASMLARGVGTLPQSLDEALDCFEADPIVREALGPIAEEFLALKSSEWREYHAEVGAWELRRYLTAL